MILDNYKFPNDLVTHKKLNFNRSFRTWKGMLTERVINIFKWSNLPMPQKEIEIVLAFTGFVGFTRFRKSKELGSVYGSMSGVTNYPDIFTNFTYATPLESGVRTIDKDIVVIDNNQLRMPTQPIIEMYATLLAHTDLSLQAILINSRATGLVKAKTQQQVENIASWYSSLANGKTLAVLDEQNLESLLNDKGMEILNFTYPSNMTIDAYYQIRENLLKSFYSEIGINSMRDKRERVVTEELDTNLNRIIFNIDDMLKCRQEACVKINKMFGINISVEYNAEIKKQMEMKEGETNDNQSDASENDN